MQLHCLLINIYLQEKRGYLDRIFHQNYQQCPCGYNQFLSSNGLMIKKMTNPAKFMLPDPKYLP